MLCFETFGIRTTLCVRSATSLSSALYIMTKPQAKFKLASDKAPVIVQILPALVRGGVERGTVEMVRAIQAAGGRACGDFEWWAAGAAYRAIWWQAY
jgi:hypothetical protein